ncbi:MAG: L-lactate permease, partial [Candidatus Thorarchaeota archaeon]
LVNQTTLTNVAAGIAVMTVLMIYTRLRHRSLVDRSTLTEDDLRTERGMSLVRASSPWVILVALCLLTNLIPEIKYLLFNVLTFPVKVGDYPTPGGAGIPTRFLWQAYTLMLIATVLSMPFLRHDRATLRNTMIKTLHRAPRPVLASAIFFSMAEVMNFSGYSVGTGGWTFPTDPSNNMIFLLATLTSSSLGPLYPMTAAFLGLLAGFISGSEASAIKMFTRYHYETSNLIGANAIVVAASNGIGGGLASVLSPAKIQNAAAVIDRIGIEGEVIRYGLVVAILMTLVTALVTMWFAFL